MKDLSAKLKHAKWPNRETLQALACFSRKSYFMYILYLVSGTVCMISMTTGILAQTARQTPPIVAPIAPSVVAPQTVAPPTALSTGSVCDANGTIFSIAGLCVENKINLSVLVTILLFALGYIITKIIERRSKHHARRIYLLALLQEIKLNVESLNHAQILFPSTKELYKFLREEPINGSSRRPFITFNFYSTIFKTKTEVLQDLENSLIGSIIEFYGRLEGIAIDIAAVDKKSFDTISAEGKDEIFIDIMRDLSVCLAVGRNVDSGIRLYLKLA